jgi:hypothetical protein
MLEGVPIAQAGEDLEVQTRQLRERLLERIRTLETERLTTASTADETSAGSDEPLREKALDRAEHAAGQLRDFSIALAHELCDSWSSLVPRHRLILGAATVGGLLAGLSFGMMLPVWAAGFVTALFGAAIWLPAAAWIGVAAQLPGQHFVQGRTAAWWLMVWGVVTVIGLMVQWSGLLSRKKPEREGPSLPAR